MDTVPRPRGTRDFTPEEMALRREMERRLRDMAIRFGYGEVATPTFEHAELFTRRSGEGVVEQMYIFTDKGGRQLALRPELTAPVARMYAETMERRYPKPLKVFYFGNAFRYERTQKGRYREFWQFGVENIGAPSLEADAEVIELAYRSLKAMGVKDMHLRVGHIGLTRAILRDNLGEEDISEALLYLDKGMLDELSEMLHNKIPDNAESVLRMLSFSMPIGNEPDVQFDGLYADMFGELLRVSEILSALGIEGTVTTGIVRGLDYYTGIVFEVEAPSLGAEKQICGGGRYDLSEAVGKDGVIATGFAIGFDRAILALGGNPQDEPNAGVYVIPVSRNEIVEGMKVASRLRRDGARAECDTTGRKVKKAINYALSKNYRFVAFIGEQEMKSGVVSLKDLSSGEQEEVPLDKLIEKVIN